MLTYYDKLKQNRISVILIRVQRLILKTWKDDDNKGMSKTTDLVSKSNKLHPKQEHTKNNKS